MSTRKDRIEAVRLDVRMLAIERRIAESKGRRRSGEVVIAVLGEIGTDCKGADIVAQIRAARGRPLRIIINSRGGSTKHGEQIVQALQLHDAPVATEAFFAASMAAIIFCVGQQRSIAPDGRVFFHVGHIMAGAELRADTLRTMAKHLEDFRRRCERIVFAATRAPMARVRTWFLGDGQSFTPEQAIAAGLAHRIVDSAPVTAEGRRTIRSSVRRPDPKQIAALINTRHLAASPEFKWAAAEARKAARMKARGLVTW